MDSMLDLSLNPDPYFSVSRIRNRQNGPDPNHCKAECFFRFYSYVHRFSVIRINNLKETFFHMQKSLAQNHNFCVSSEQLIYIFEGSKSDL